MKETKLIIIEDILTLIDFIKKEGTGRERRQLRFYNGNCKFCLYQSKELTIRSLQKNKKEVLDRFREFILEEIIYQ